MPRRCPLEFIANPSILLPRLAKASGYNLEEMARRTQLSRRTIERHIRRLSGSTPGWWLKQLRLANSIPFLAAGNLSCKATASVMGYKHPSQFARDFKAVFGISPSNVRTEGYINRGSDLRFGQRTKGPLDKGNGRPPRQ